MGYREQARTQLEALEPARVLARKEGRPFVPRPITFDFSEAQKHNGHAPMKIAGQ
jgi:hypothetical protein